MNRIDEKDKIESEENRIEFFPTKYKAQEDTKGLEGGNTRWVSSHARV